MLAVCLVSAALSFLPTHSLAADRDGIDISGDWAGEVVIGTFEMRVLFRIKELPNGNITATLSAPDKSELPVPVTVITRDEREVRIDVDSIGGKYRGKLSGNGKRMRGDWTQGEYDVELDLDLVEGGFAQARPQTPKPPLRLRRRGSDLPEYIFQQKSLRNPDITTIQAIARHRPSHCSPGVRRWPAQPRRRRLRPSSLRCDR